ncbi:type II secretion system F family protein [Ihubacter massiliensis]|uniref:Type II secretion system F family protein n=1 Tax=Hominibacterium faecale TaxID=2839743 RepID=A0A9J6QPI9_9FIRM|nr:MULTISPECIES: type II secretion system F family protein [Eubacteriales Family XIII. Incertae Sedis]MCO7123096.1 type II secretion system F family protein [Ihubacter massiliensis]MCU7377356.1 type II secretion system F family protein [Hominibacterium faecale]
MRKKTRQKKAEELALLLNELGMFFNGGIPLYDAFLIMEENSSNDDDRSLYHMIGEEIEQGMDLSDALKHTGRFPDYMIQMIRIGENSGKLEEVFSSLALYYQRQDHLTSSLRSAVIYPLAMVLVMLLILAVLMIKVLPVFSQVFTQVGAQLPAPLEAAAGSGSAAAVAAVCALGVIVLCLILYGLIRRKEEGRRFLAHLYEGFPLTRKIAEKSAANRFAYSMALLLASGINVDEAVDLVRELNRSPRAGQKLTKLKGLMDEGETFPHALTSSGILSSEYSSMIAVGLKTGSGEEMMDLVAQRLSSDTDRYIDRTLSGIEPAIVIIMCLMIGSVLLSVMLPLMKIMTAM